LRFVIEENPYDPISSNYKSHITNGKLQMFLAINLHRLHLIDDGGPGSKKCADEAEYDCA